MTITTWFDEQGRSWVVWPDEAWKKAEFFTYVNGMDIT